MDTDNLELLQRMLLGEATQQIERPCLLGDEKVILAANEAACRLLDYPLPDLLARGPADISQLQQDELGRLFDLLRERGRLSGSVWLRQRDGTDLAMEFAAWLVRIAGAPACLTWFRPAVGPISGRPISLAEPVTASYTFCSYYGF
jgi:PAS domain-containing protein